ncbi:hypothetical protein RDE2_27370 [Rhodococcus sp. RDE2]|nr:hypothetical protein RDE2_27370 [Rhodococcus sp. RDE2]
MHEILVDDDADAVDPDHGVLRVHAQALFDDDVAVDLDATRGDEFLGCAARGNAGLGEHLLQPHAFTGGQLGGAGFAMLVTRGTSVAHGRNDALRRALGGRLTSRGALAVRFAAGGRLGRFAASGRLAGSGPAIGAG